MQSACSRAVRVLCCCVAPDSGQHVLQNTSHPALITPPSVPVLKHDQLTVQHMTFKPVPTSHPPHLPPCNRELKVLRTRFLGNVHSTNTTVKRDLGFQGRLGDHIFLTYGDTMYSDHQYSDTWRGMTSNSVALATHDPLAVYDPVLNQQRYPPQFCPTDERYGEDCSSFAVGITNIIETLPGQGMLYYLLNRRPDGFNNLIGAGVATVKLHHDPSSEFPSISIHRPCPPQPQYMWCAETEPWYGDVSAIRVGEQIYAYGHAKDNPWVYLARSPWRCATDIDRYEYWNGSDWQRERLLTKNLTEKEAVFWQINQGQVIWSEWLGKFLFVYCDNWMNSKVLARTSMKPEGPWSEPAITLYQATPIAEGSTVYAAIPHPYYDLSGETLVVTFTNHPNVIQAVRVTLE